MSQAQPSEMDNIGGPYLQQCGKSRHIAHKPSTSPRTNRLPLYITHQDPKNAVKLVEETLNTKSFHIKRIYADKHMLFRQNIPGVNKAKEILIATKTFYA